MRFRELAWCSVLLFFSFVSVLFVQAQDDTTSPVLVGFGISPQQVDTTSAAADVNFFLHATDDISGILHVQVNIASPSGLVGLGIGSTNNPVPISGTALDGIFPV